MNVDVDPTGCQLVPSVVENLGSRLDVALADVLDLAVSHMDITDPVDRLSRIDDVSATENKTIIAGGH